MRTYAAYLRIYEPVSAFHEPDRSRWTAYAASATRPRRYDSLSVEHAGALRRALAAPTVVVPERESEDAYVRRADGVTYICPWQTRLRCLLAYGRMLTAGTPVPGTVPAADDDDQAMAALAQLETSQAASRLHILGSMWAVPLGWFVLFAAGERWLSLGPDTSPPDAPSPAAGATAAATRALIYTTPMARARRRVARGLAALRSVPAGYGGAGWDPVRAEAELAEVGRWLEEFHPYSLAELDYGGLVHMLSDHALAGDASVAEMRAAMDGAARGQWELAAAMHQRADARWRTFAAFEQAN